MHARCLHADASAAWIGDGRYYQPAANQRVVRSIMAGAGRIYGIISRKYHAGRPWLRVLLFTALLSTSHHIVREAMPATAMRAALGHGAHAYYLRHLEHTRCCALLFADVAFLIRAGRRYGAFPLPAKMITTPMISP